MRFWGGLGVLIATSACASIVGLSDYEIVDQAVDAGDDASARADSATPTDATDANDANDASTDAIPDVTPSCSCAPTAWTSVLYAADRSTPCPNDLIATDVVTEPVAQPCTCGACQVALPSCNQGNFTTALDSSAAPKCENGMGTSRPANGGNCNSANGMLAQHARVVPPTPSGSASCTAAGTVTGVTTKSVRVCRGGSLCACETASAAPFTSCLETAGDVACPTGFSTKHLVGESATATCGACNCAVANAKCSASVTYYSDTSCAAALVTINDTTCTVTNEKSFSSLKFTGTSTGTCTVTPGTSVAALAGRSTVCCR